MILLVRLGLAVGLIGAIAVVFISSSGFGRVAGIGNSIACYRGLYFSDPVAAPKAAFIGSSRIRRGLDPDQFGAAFGWPDRAVLNFGHPGTSSAFDAAFIAEFAARDVAAGLETLVVEIYPQSHAQRTREDQAARQNRTKQDLTLTTGPAEELYYIGASWGALFRDAFRDADGVGLALWDALKLASTRIKRHVVYAIKRRTITRVFRVDADIDRSRPNACVRKAWLGDAPGGETQERLIADTIAAFAPDETGARWRDETPDGFFTDPEHRRNRAAVARFARLGRDRGLAVYGLYLPGVGTPQPDPARLARIRAEYGIELLVPGPDLRAVLEDGLYFDNVHLNGAGRRLLTAWLADEIAARRETAAGPAPHGATGHAALTVGQAPDAASGAASKAASKAAGG